MLTTSALILGLSRTRSTAIHFRSNLLSDLSLFPRSFSFSHNRPYSRQRFAHPSRFPMPSPSRSPCPKSKVLVLGAGNFGSCLADHLGDSNHEVYMWSREADIVEYFNQHHRNPRYLQDHDFPKNITAIGPDLPDAELIKQVDVLLFAIPTEGVRWGALLFFCVLNLRRDFQVDIDSTSTAIG